MCELFGVSGNDTIYVNDYLSEFASHSKKHPDGWGMAQFFGNAVSVEKEPVMASSSMYLRERLRHRLEVRNMIAHIRKATRGQLTYENSHPFVKRDRLGRAWTLVHNGTIFDCSLLDRYSQIQEGHTDSERILYYIVDQIDRAQVEKGCMLELEERFELMDQIIHTIAPRNKVNLLIYDGDVMYVHTNYRNSLYQKREGNSMLFATVPLDKQEWTPVKFMVLQAYRNGEKILEGTPHQAEYIENQKDLKYLHLDSAAL